jgi:protein gp37
VAESTAIGWTNATWNPWQGCTKVSAGCANCYMYSEKTRYGQDPHVVVRSSPHTFNGPRSAKRYPPGSLIFTCSWSDFMHRDADPWRAEAVDIMADRLDATFQVLTKRVERLDPLFRWPDNVWLGMSIENQDAMDKRWPIWRTVSHTARVRFLSTEPLLGPVVLPGTIRDHIDWIIVGGESGSKARPCDVEWIASIVQQARLHGIAVFVKQDSGPRAGQQGRIPTDLWLKEYPEVLRG